MIPMLELAREAEPAARPVAASDEPTYAPAVIARWLRMPVGVVRRWTLGIDGHPPVIRAADPDAQLLSFRNVAEIHLLSGVMTRERGRVPLSIVRAVLALLEEQLQSQHVLAHPRMEEDGKDIFAARFALLTGGTRHEQAAVAAELTRHVQRIRRDERGAPVRLLLFTGTRSAEPAHVSLAPAVRSGQPCIDGSDVRTATVSAEFRSGASVAALARSHGRTAEEIEEAIRFELSLH